MALIPPGFLDTVIAIGVGDDAETRAWIGTGFLFGKYVTKDPESEEKLYEIYLITNKHVLNNHKRIYIKLNSSQELNSRDYEITLKFKNGRSRWVGHPSTDIDVAALMLNPSALKKENRRYSVFASDSNVLLKETMISSGISEGDGIFVLGFPMGLVDTDFQYVICRGGNIARIRDLLEGKSTDFLIDAPVFPGNSGGPIIFCPSTVAIKGTKSINRSALIGIVKAYKPYRDVAISGQTNKARISFEENSGLAVVESVDSILETVCLASKRIKRRKNLTKSSSKNK